MPDSFVIILWIICNYTGWMYGCTAVLLRTFADARYNNVQCFVWYTLDFDMIGALGIRHIISPQHIILKPINQQLSLARIKVSNFDIRFI